MRARRWVAGPEGQSRVVKCGRRGVLVSVGWVCYAEKSHAEALPHISTVKSPQGVMGTLVKRYLAERCRPPRASLSCPRAPRVLASSVPPSRALVPTSPSFPLVSSCLSCPRVSLALPWCRAPPRSPRRHPRSFSSSHRRASCLSLTPVHACSGRRRLGVAPSAVCHPGSQDTIFMSQRFTGVFASAKPGVLSGQRGVHCTPFPLNRALGRCGGRRQP